MMNKQDTITAIKALAALKPKALMKHYNMETFKTLSRDMKPENIIAVFKTYKALDNGNTKLAKGILSFSLLPVITCNQHCSGCYDVRSLRYKSVRLKRIVNTLLAAGHREWLQARIIKQVQNSRTVTAVRIHVGGDFFSRSYVGMWQEIAANISHKVNVYTYTKTEYTQALEAARINVVKSKYGQGIWNFGPKDVVQLMAKHYSGVVCPATLRNVPDQYCGSGCKACQTRSAVFFVIH